MVTIANPVTASTTYSRPLKETVDFGAFKYDITHEKNDIANRSGLTQFKNYIGTAEGAYKWTDLFSKAFREVVEISRLAKNHAVATAMQGSGAIFSRAASGFIIPYAAYTAVELNEAACEVAVKGGSYGRVEKLVYSVLNFVTSSSYALLQFIPGHTTLKSIATVADLGTESIDLRQEANLWSQADDFQKVLTLSKETHADLAQMKTQHLLGMMKSVVGVTGAIFAFLALVFTAAVVPPIVTATMSLFVVALSIIKHCHADNMDNKLKLTLVTA